MLTGILCSVFGLMLVSVHGSDLPCLPTVRTDKIRVSLPPALNSIQKEGYVKKNDKFQQFLCNFNSNMCHKACCHRHYHNHNHPYPMVSPLAVKKYFNNFYLIIQP